MKAAILSFTRDGKKLGDRIKGWLEGQGYEAEADVRCKALPESVPESLDQWTRERFGKADALIYIGAAGIAVRAVAPYVQSKISDPAVLVIDEQGTYCIPLLSGHLGGANDLTLRLAEAFRMEPVVTTATDRNQKWAVDEFARKNGLRIRDMELAKRISADILEGKEIRILIDNTKKGRIIEEKPDVYVGFYEHPGWKDTLYLIPPVAVLGIGCRKGVSGEQIRVMADKILEDYGICPECVRAAATIDRKGEEPGLLKFCEDRDLPLLTFSAEELLKAEGEFTPSEFVRQVTGVENVCERSAVTAAGGGRVLIPKQKKDGVTVSLAVTDWSVEFEESICGRNGDREPGTNDRKSPAGIRIL